MKKSVERFTATVQDYIKYRPSYPQEVLSLLVNECGLTQEAVIADIGSGTGLLSKLLLDHGNKVYGVEPNQAMREAAESYLKNYSDFYNINGTAEATTLENQSVDMVTAGTAFHWFNPEKTKLEFKRILKPSGWVLLIWNVRNMAQSPFMQDYENLLMNYAPDYKNSNAIKFDKTVGKEFFSPNEMKTASFKNTQQFDWAGLQGRLFSTSYSLRPGDSNYENMLKALNDIYNQYQKNGVIEFLYDAKLYYGRIHE